MKFSAVVVALALFASANAVPFNKRQDPKPFAHDNGVAAQKLNDDFKKLTADSPCTDGQSACVDGGFAQCVGNKFQITQCGGGTSCFALPLVNKPGTSITCTTQADADSRIATALGTPAGSGNTPASSTTPASSPPKTPPKSGNPSTGKNCKTVRSCNAQDAIKLAKDFQKLNSNSPCTSGQNACVKGAFAQCVNGKFVSMPCSAGLSCQVLPLVNARGTSITCDTKADAQARIDDALKN
uniref:Endochitinase n=1 Tax=Anthurium amnicola TaxID=1678845 RepID=A0A1D1XPD7_9ARAE